MNIKNMLRKVLFSALTDSQIELFYKIYYRLCYNDEMQKKIKKGNQNKDLVFYVIRPRKDCVEGLLSLFWNVVRNINYAEEHNYIPVVDFQNYKTQYTMKDNENDWNYFFTQPSNYSLDVVYKSKNVILSGLEIQWYKKSLFKANYDQAALDNLHQKIFKSIDFSPEVKKSVNEEITSLNLELDNSIGLYLRGTDYTSLKPSGHPVQPTVSQAIEVVDNYLNKYNIISIFLVTEDGEIHDSIKKRYGNMCVTPKFDKYIYGYNGKKLLSNDEHIKDLADNPYERGMQYLIKMIILSKCGYLIGGNTNGMWAVNVFAENAFKDKYIFDLGVYGK